jgi:hypothetical protein
LLYGFCPKVLLDFRAGCIGQYLLIGRHVLLSASAVELRQDLETRLHGLSRVDGLISIQAARGRLPLPHSTDVCFALSTKVFLNLFFGRAENQVILNTLDVLVQRYLRFIDFG